jgi:hypothetical protein
VIPDELSSFDDEHVQTFLKNVKEAIAAGLLMQFVGLSTPRKELRQGADQGREKVTML